jgi:hypothetical protein
MENKIFILECEDLSHLGGPMGTEYTTPVFTEIFSSVKKAKEYAETFYWPAYCAWLKNTNSIILWVADASCYGYKIKKAKVDPKPVKSNP